MGRMQMQLKQQRETCGCLGCSECLMRADLWEEGIVPRAGVDFGPEDKCTRPAKVKERKTRAWMCRECEAAH